MPWRIVGIGVSSGEAEVWDRVVGFWVRLGSWLGSLVEILWYDD